MDTKTIKWVVLIILIGVVAFYLKKTHMTEKSQAANTSVAGDGY